MDGVLCFVFTFLPLLFDDVVAQSRLSRQIFAIQKKNGIVLDRVTETK